MSLDTYKETVEVSKKETFVERMKSLVSLSPALRRLALVGLIAGGIFAYENHNEGGSTKADVEEFEKSLGDGPDAELFREAKEVVFGESGINSDVDYSDLSSSLFAVDGESGFINYISHEETPGASMPTEGTFSVYVNGKTYGGEAYDSTGKDQVMLNASKFEFSLKSIKAERGPIVSDRTYVGGDVDDVIKDAIRDYVKESGVYVKVNKNLEDESNNTKIDNRFEYSSTMSSEHVVSYDTVATIRPDGKAEVQVIIYSIK